MAYLLSNTKKMLSDQEKTSELVLPKSLPESDPETPFQSPVVPRSEATGLQFTIDHGTYVWYLKIKNISFIAGLSLYEFIA